MNGNVIKLGESWRKLEVIKFYKSKAYLEFRKRVKFKVGVMKVFIMKQMLKVEWRSDKHWNEVTERS